MRLLLLAGLAAVTACQTVEPETSSTEQALTGVIFSPPSGGSLGSVQVGNQSAAFGISINPTGLVDVSYTIDSITGCSDFIVNAPGLPAPVYKTCIDTNPCFAGNLQCIPQANIVCYEWDIQGYDFSAVFRPGAQGPSSCALQIQVGGLGLKTYTINGDGTLPPIDIDVAPTAVNFGDVRRTTASSDAAVTVRNLGGQTLTVTSATVSSGYTITSGPTGTYQIGTSGAQGYTITCNPSVTGSLPGTFRVTSDDPATPTSTVNLACNGIDSSLNVVPSPAAVPTTRVGEPTQRQVTLANAGAASMSIQSATLTGAGLTATGLPLPGATIAGGASVNAMIKFDAMTAGDATGALTIVYDGGQMRSIPISAKALATSMSLSPDGAIDLGPVCVGQTGAKSITIAANNEGSFKVTGVSTPDAPFSVTAPALPATLLGAGANNQTITVSTAPTTVGPATSTVTVTTDIPSSTPRALELSVTGLTAGVSATPLELDLGPSMVNTPTIGQEVSVTNCSTSAAELMNARIEGDDAADFAIVQAPSLMLGPNDTVSWLIIANPHSTGSKSALFSVDHAGGTASVMLNADGLGDPVGMDPGAADGPASYYACSAGTGSAMWPIGIALGVLLLRRRRR
jgi:hypothetical protein